MKQEAQSQLGEPSKVRVTRLAIAALAFLFIPTILRVALMMTLGESCGLHRAINAGAFILCTIIGMVIAVIALVRLVMTRGASQGDALATVVLVLSPLLSLRVRMHYIASLIISLFRKVHFVSRWPVLPMP